MKRTPSARKMINTELAIRSANGRVKRVMRNHTPKEEQPNLKIDFYCECSDPACGEHVSLTLKEYEDLHTVQSAFVIAKGHATPLVEKVVKTNRNTQVVEKYAL